MSGKKKAFGARKVTVGIALCCAVAAPLAVVATGCGGGSDSPGGDPKVAIATGKVGGFDSPKGGPDAASASAPVDWVSTHQRVLRHEALPCTGPEDPMNFETFTVGPAVAGLPMVGSSRRCDPGASAGQVISNEITYSYGSCKIPDGASGCQRPLIVQTWPACQRSLADYSYEGRPMPYRELPKLGDARVVEIEFPDEHRLEVYTRSVTVVIFALNHKLAEKALRLLRPRQAGLPPAVHAKELRGKPKNSLEPPSDGAVEGVLPCHI